MSGVGRLAVNLHAVTIFDSRGAATSAQPKRSRTDMSTAKVECVDCDEAKAKSEAKHSKAAAQDHGLRLGPCAEHYERWVACIESVQGSRNVYGQGQCKAELAAFRACREKAQS